MKLKEVVARLDEFAPEETIYAEDAGGDARAEVGPDDARTDLPYLLEVALAQEAIDVWREWRPRSEPTLEDKVQAVTYYARNDAWLPVE